jgi:hypothetical protein
MNNWILYSLLKNNNVNIDSVVAAAVAKIVGNADTSFDTLEEIAAWIEAHPESVAAINKEIQNIKTQLENIELTPGPAGATPEIGNNGNWIIAGVDTGITALGTVISSTRINEQGHLIISFTDGSEFDAGNVTGEQGPQGIQGKPFTIAKTYSSIEEMNNDFYNEAIDSGAFVIIVSETNDEDNAKLYVKGETSYTYVVDLSGM